MFLANVDQDTNRINYYNVNAVPTAIWTGHTYIYSLTVLLIFNLVNPYYTRLNKGTPIGIHVTDTRIAGDSIKSDITVKIISPLSAGITS